MFKKHLIFFIIFLALRLSAYAQCPTPSLTGINPTDEQCYHQNDGQIIFTFNDGVSPDGTNYRIQLYEFDSSQFVWDDNAILLGTNKIPAPLIAGNTVT